MKKIRTWADNINNVIRDVIFPDQELKDLMMIPEADNSDIIAFIQKYFIRDPSPDELLTNQDVRICYGDMAGTPIGKYAVRKNMFFDIYVKQEHEHDVDNDVLKYRSDVLCSKLRELLTDQKYVCHIAFNYVDDYILFTKTIGYTRHRILFSYNITF